MPCFNTDLIGSSGCGRAVGFFQRCYLLSKRLNFKLHPFFFFFFFFRKDALSHCRPLRNSRPWNSQADQQWQGCSGTGDCSPDGCTNILWPRCTKKLCASTKQTWEGKVALSFCGGWSEGGTAEMQPLGPLCALQQIMLEGVGGVKVKQLQLQCICAIAALDKKQKLLILIKH